MATAPVEQFAAANSIAVIVAQTPAVVLTDEAQRDALFDHIQREMDEFVPDVSSASGRAAIKSFAFKITRTKTAIDDAGKKLNEDARARINVVDAARRVAKEKLEAMAKSVRQPLTEWEEAEEKRVTFCRSVIASFKSGAVVTMEDTAATVRARGEAAWEVNLDPDVFGDMLDEAQTAKEATIAVLQSALKRLTQEEADRAELDRLRAEKAEADRIAAEKAEAERVEREIREAEEFAARDAERRQKAEQERIERAAREAEEKARREAEQAAEAERQRVQREHEAALKAERDRAAELERQAQIERDRIAAEDAARANREADQAHRTSVKTAAKTALMTCGADEETARKIVVAILAGEIPQVRMEF